MLVPSRVLLLIVQRRIIIISHDLQVGSEYLKFDSLIKTEVWSCCVLV